MKTSVIKKTLLIISLCVLFFILQNCGKDTTVNEPLELINTRKDTVKLFVSEGVYLEIKGLKNSYQLDEELIFKLMLVNESDSNGFPLNTEDGYLNYANFVKIFDEDGNYVCGKTFTKQLDTLLMPNQSFGWEFKWNQSDNNNYGTNQWTRDFATFGMKVYTGKYNIRAQHYGNDSLENKFVTKWIEITEEGEPLNGIALRHDTLSTDSIKVDFILRNRINKTLKCLLNNTKTMEVYIGGSNPQWPWGSIPPEHIDTIQLNFEQESIVFQSKSDKLICNYSISKNDTIYTNIKGDKELYFIIELDERKIYTRAHVYF